MLLCSALLMLVSCNMLHFFAHKQIHIVAAICLHSKLRLDNLELCTFGALMWSVLNADTLLYANLHYIILTQYIQ